METARFFSEKHPSNSLAPERSKRLSQGLQILISYTAQSFRDTDLKLKQAIKGGKHVTKLYHPTNDNHSKLASVDLLILVLIRRAL